MTKHHGFTAAFFTGNVIGNTDGRKKWMAEGRELDLLDELNIACRSWDLLFGRGRGRGRGHSKFVRLLLGATLRKMGLCGDGEEFCLFPQRSRGRPTWK